MKTKLIKSVFVGIIAIVASINVFNAQKSVVLSDVAMANVEALADWENNVDCPEPYDVKNHQLDFVQRTGEFRVSVDGSIYINGKSKPIGTAYAGLTISVVYELGNCGLYSPGNCCPNSRNGEVRIIGYS